MTGIRQRFTDNLETSRTALRYIKKFPLDEQEFIYSKTIDFTV